MSGPIARSTVATPLRTARNPFRCAARRGGRRGGCRRPRTPAGGDPPPPGPAGPGWERAPTAPPAGEPPAPGPSGSRLEAVATGSTVRRAPRADVVILHVAAKRPSTRTVPNRPPL